MPAPKKPTPLRYCEECEKQLERKRLPNGDLEYLIHFNRRKFCDQCCMGLNFDRRHSPDAGWSAAHWEARSLVPPGPCVRCGKPQAKDVHHKDLDFQNNSLTNLERICRSCHNRSTEIRLMRDLWQASEGIGVLRNALSAIQEARRPTGREGQPVRTDTQGQRTKPTEGLQGAGLLGQVPREGVLQQTCPASGQGTLGQPQLTRREAALVRWWSEG